MAISIGAGVAHEETSTQALDDAFGKSPNRSHDTCRDSATPVCAANSSRRPIVAATACQSADKFLGFLGGICELSMALNKPSTAHRISHIGRASASV